MQENKEKITKEFCRGRILLFYPKTEGEAEFIQRRIFAMGYEWGHSLGRNVQFAERCVSGGMVLSNGVLYHSPTEERLKEGLLCTSEQFDESYVPPLSVEQQIKALAEEVTALRKTVDAIYEAVGPRIVKRLDSPSPKA